MDVCVQRETAMRVHLRQLRRESNLWRRVRFLLDGRELTMRVTPTVEDWTTDINAESAVGAALVWAEVGERIEVETPGGSVVVKVLEVE